MTTTEKILVFKIGRGGHFNNPGHRTYEGVGDINDYTRNFFLSDEKEDENTQWLDGGGNEVGLPFINDGTGCIDIDGDYNTIYAKKLTELSDDELRIVIESDDKPVLEDYAKWLGYNDMSIKLMGFFNDYEGALIDDYQTPNEYIKLYYNVYDSKEEAEADGEYIEIEGKFYTNI